MNLDNFESYIDKRILARGIGYYENDYISSIEQVSEGVYEATVLGTNVYQVEAELDNKGNIIETYCDCPYDMGEYCKHQVAVFLALRDNINKTAAEWPYNTSIIKRSKNKDIKKILSEATKDDLVDFMLDIASEYKIRQRIELSFGIDDDEDEINNCIIMIRTYIQKNSDRSGFVRYEDTYEAVKGAEMVLYKARNARYQDKLMYSLTLTLCVIREMMDLLNDSDDLDGIVGGLIREGFELIESISNEETLSGECKQKIFHKLMEEASNKRYDGWDDWRLELLESCSRLADSPQLRNYMDNHLISLMEIEKGDSWSSNYFTEKINLIRYHMIEKYDGKKKAQEFLNQNLKYSEFREMAIKNAMDIKDYDKVIKLARDGEERDKNFLGLVKQWKQFGYQAYKKLAKLEEMRELALDFVLDGSMEHYDELKNSYKAKDWISIYPKIILMLETYKKTHNNVYVRILIAEGEKQKLLEFVKATPSSIEIYYK